MTIKDLKNWINKFGPEMDDVQFIIREFGKLDDGYNFKLDKPISFADFDIETNEAFVTDEENFQKMKEIESDINEGIKRFKDFK
jgi:hypothetical protein